MRKVIENTIREITDTRIANVVRDTATRAGIDAGDEATDLMIARKTSNLLLLKVISVKRKNPKLADKYRAAITTLENNIATINGGKRINFNWETAQ